MERMRSLLHRPAGRTQVFQAAIVAVVATSLALFAAPAAIAARGHVFATSFGSTGSGEGQFEEPAGVAVDEASGRVYVVDKGDDRVEYFSAAGSYEGQIDGPSAEGAGNLVEGSTRIKSVSTSAGAFTIGEEVSTGDLPPGTTITAVISPAVLEVSSAATATQTGALLTAQQSFSEPETIAVDNSCQLQRLSGGACTAADPSNEDVYVADAGSGSVYKFTSAGDYVGEVTGFEGEPFNRLYGVGVGQDGKLFVYNEAATGGQLVENIAIFTNEASNEYVEYRPRARFLPLPRPQFALDGNQRFYVGYAEGTEAHEEARVAELSSDGSLVESPFCSNEDESAVAVEAGTEDVYVDNLTTVARCTAEGSLRERFGAGHLAQGSGIAVDTASSTVYVADASQDAVDVFVPEPAGPPSIEAGSVLAVGAHNATVTAQIRVKGEAAQYAVEYGACTSLAACRTDPYSGETAPITLEAAFESVGHDSELSGLAPRTVYHARFRAFGGGGASTGQELVFTTEPTGGEFALPDSRAWELVTPPDKHGTLIPPIGGALIQAATGGEALTYSTLGPLEEEPQGNGDRREQALSRRGPGGWSTEEIVAPYPRSTGLSIGAESEYKLFSADLSLGITEPAEHASPLLSAEASGWTPYLRHDFVPSVPGHAAPGRQNCVDTPSACWTPLVTSKQGYADIAPPGAPTGVYEESVEGATANLDHVIVHGEYSGKLYEWTATEPWEKRLSDIGKLPDGETVECGTGGEAHLADNQDFGMGNAVAEEGARIFFEVIPCNSEVVKHHLYMYATASGESVAIDVVQPGAEQARRESEATGPAFQTANANGTKVYFTDTQRLTAESGRDDLYLCEIAKSVATGKLECALADLTPKSEAGENAEVQGRVLGAGEDAGYVYFVADAALTGAASNQSGAGAVAGQPNLYVRDGSRLAFIATLSFEDAADWSGSGTLQRDQVSRVSSNGRWLAFMSDRPLTGYDNRDVSSDEVDEEVYIYDATSGALSCASCDPTGARPEGEEIENAYAAVNDDSNGPWYKRWLTATVPSLTNATLDTSPHQARYLSNGGRLFFDARDALAPQAKNHTWDVYEYEPAKGEEQPGSDGCTVASQSYSEQDGGCVALISPGTAEGESVFLDASEDGNDVFFMTAAKLVGKDYDAADDIYDAHVCSSESPCAVEAVAPLECTTTESCRQAPPPQPSAFAAPSSATFSGTGDVGVRPRSVGKLTRKQKLAKALRACHRDKRARKRWACERMARRRFRARRVTNGHAGKRSGR